jgi:hypothetical protein
LPVRRFQRPFSMPPWLMCSSARKSMTRRASKLRDRRRAFTPAGERHEYLADVAVALLHSCCPLSCGDKRRI